MSPGVEAYRACLAVVVLVFSLQVAATLRPQIDDLLSSRDAGALSRRLEQVLEQFNDELTAALLHADSTQSGHEQLEYMEEILRYVEPRKRSTIMRYINGEQHDLTSLVRNAISHTHGHAVNGDEILREFWQSFETTPMATNSSMISGCTKDYSQFVVPITSNIGKSVIQAICDRFGIGATLCGWLIQLLPDKTMPDWGRKMIDAMSKIPAGIRDGKVAWVGAYDLCHAQHVDYYYNDTEPPENRTFDGMYCRLDIKMATGVPPLEFGVCVPNTCSREEVFNYITYDNKLLSLLLKATHWNISEVYCGHKTNSATDISYQACMGIFVITIILTILASIYDGFFRKMILRRKVVEMSERMAEVIKSGRGDLKKINKIGIIERLELLFVAFSGYSNSCRIFTVRTKRGHLPVLDGVRYISYAYAIWGVTYMWGPLYSETWSTQNLVGAAKTIPKLASFQPILNAHLVEDSFLLIGGILVTYWFLKRCENCNVKQIFLKGLFFIVHRYWRLMPVLMLSIMFISSTYKYTADGPLYPIIDHDCENCKVNWWVNLLMVNNLVHVHQQCFGHAWFVSVAFQLYLASLFIIIPLAIKPVVGYIILAVTYCVHIGVTGYISYTSRVEGGGAWYYDYFITAWCRAGPYLIGHAVGILLYHKRKGFKINIFVVLLLWLIAIALIATATFVTYGQYQNGLNRWSTEALTVYDTLARSGWALGLSWIVVACTWGYGGVISELLCWRAFLPLSRLCYASMVMHAPMMFAYVYTMRVPMYIDPFHMMNAAFGHIINTMLMGLVFALLWDYPMGIRWEKVVTCRTRLEWFRAGRHPRRKVNEIDGAMKLENDRHRKFSTASKKPNKTSPAQEANCDVIRDAIGLPVNKSASRGSSPAQSRDEAPPTDVIFTAAF